MCNEIAVHQTVGHEVAVVRGVIELAAKSKPLAAIGQLLRNAVVFPLPDKSTLQTGRVVERIPIVGK